MNYRIPFSGRAHRYTDHEIEVVTDVMRSDDGLTQAKHLANFEKIFSKYVNCDNAFAVMNATAALEISAQFLQIEEGDEVIIPSHTFTSSAYPFAKKGATLRWADVDPKTHVVTVDSILEQVSEKTRAVVVVHLYGYCADMPEIAKMCKQRNIFLIEDAAQALGSRIDQRFAGTFGDMGIYSFHSHKNITTLGEGGMLVVSDPEIASLVPLVRHNGHCSYPEDREAYWKPAMGDLKMPMYKGKLIWPNNYCIGEVECALGVELLSRVDDLNAEKRIRGLKFIDGLGDQDILSFLREPSERHVYHLLVAEVKNGLRDDLIKTLSMDFGIQCVVQYNPLNRYPLYHCLGQAESHCPEADNFFDNMISFPFQHWMEEEDFAYMQAAVASAIDTLA